MPLSWKGNYAPQLISSTGIYCMGQYVAGLGMAAAATVAWGTANQAVFIPCHIPFPCVVKDYWVYNGATANGNVDVGIFEAGGGRQASGGGAAQSGTNAPQFFTASSFSLDPGYYLLGLALSSATGTTFRASVVSTTAARAFGAATMATAYPLPNPATYASYTFTGIPVFGLNITRML